MKDNFSKQATLYAKFRPEYPSELYDSILQNLENQDIAWDCATGNGQAAKVLAQYFKKVYATDISQKQIDNAVHMDKIEYIVCSAEKTPFADNTFDLITVAQAAHWFDFETFYKEVKRVAKPRATLAIWGYGTLQFPDSKTINALVQDFYTKKIGQYWDAERRFIDEEYRTLPFPFEKITPPQLEMLFYWDKNTLEGYMNTWSAVQNFIRTEGYNPVDNLMEDLSDFWQEGDIHKVRLPIFIKLAKIFKIN
jgi:ubiquinone/menaquinone biosynthesis C-methylase UbiE